jgi:DNA-directed RNA polymerase specialized sigma54-like protein
MRMHIGRTVAAVGLTAVVIGGAAGTALASSGGSSATQNTASVTAVDASAQSQSQSLAKLTYAQLAAKLGVSETALLDAIGDFKNTVTSIPGPKTSADLTTIMVKTLVPDLRISASAAEWAAAEILGGYVSN